MAYPKQNETSLFSGDRREVFNRCAVGTVAARPVRGRGNASERRRRRVGRGRARAAKGCAGRSWLRSPSRKPRCPRRVLNSAILSRDAWPSVDTRGIAGNHVLTYARQVCNRKRLVRIEGPSRCSFVSVIRLHVGDREPSGTTDGMTGTDPGGFSTRSGRPARLLDDLIGAGEERRRHGEAGAPWGGVGDADQARR